MIQFGSYLKNKIRRASKPLAEASLDQSESVKSLLGGSGRNSTKGPFSEKSLLARTVFDDLAAVNLYADAFRLQLQILRTTLHLNTAVVFFKSSVDEQLVLHSLSSLCPALIMTGPFMEGVGIAGAMNKGQNSVYLEGLSDHYSGIFYYKDGAIVGAAAIIELESISGSSSAFKKNAYLCLDRKEPSPWTDSEKNIIALFADKLAMEVCLGGMFISLGQERNLIHKICQGFRELNKGLGLESVFAATAKAVTSLVSADFVSISLLGNNSHQTAFVAGTTNLDHLLGLDYNLDEGLVGQVIRLNRPLPVNGKYSEPAPVFSRQHVLSGYKSLYILPLLPEDGLSLGAMTVAAQNDDAFGQAQMDILHLIATQVAVKIELAKSHETINKMATTDGLTDLANHRTFQHGFDIMLHRARRLNSPLTLIFCDIDFFKKINDSYGHQFGDLVLKAVAKILADAVRREDLAARYGGEEFALILENSTKNGALQMAERIRQDIADLTFEYEDETVGLTISLGIASFPEDGLEKSTILELADQALYQAKRQGRNQTVLCK